MHPPTAIVCRILPQPTCTPMPASRVFTSIGNTPEYAAGLAGDGVVRAWSYEYCAPIQRHAPLSPREIITVPAPPSQIARSPLAIQRHHIFPKNETNTNQLAAGLPVAPSVSARRSPLRPHALWSFQSHRDLKGSDSPLTEPYAGLCATYVSSCTNPPMATYSYRRSIRPHAAYPNTTPADLRIWTICEETDKETADPGERRIPRLRPRARVLVCMSRGQSTEWQLQGVRRALDLSMRATAMEMVIGKEAPYWYKARTRIPDRGHTRRTGRERSLAGVGVELPPHDKMSFPDAVTACHPGRTQRSEASRILISTLTALRRLIPGFPLVNEPTRSYTVHPRDIRHPRA